MDYDELQIQNSDDSLDIDEKENVLKKKIEIDSQGYRLTYN